MDENLESTYTFRRAIAADADFIARCVLAAVDVCELDPDTPAMEGAVAVSLAEDSLYAWTRTLIAEAGGQPVGALICYDGAVYAAARQKTFAMLAAQGIYLADSDMETGPGEFYLDSLAVIPAHRGSGLGHALMRQGIRTARDNGFGRVGIIVACEKPRLQAYYAQLGFLPEKTICAFGHQYLRMILQLKTASKQTAS